MHNLLSLPIMSIVTIIVGCLPVSVLFIFLYNKFIAPSRRETIVLKAKSDRRVVSGKLLDYRDGYVLNPEPKYSNNSKFYGSYQYKVKGKSFIYTRWYKKIPKKRIRLYYIKNPRRAVEEDKLGCIQGFRAVIIVYLILMFIVCISILAYVGFDKLFIEAF